MDLKFNVKNELGETIKAYFLGFFSVPGLDKEYAIYTIVDDNPLSKDGAILLGEVIRDNENITILGIEEDEIDIVTKCYREISEGL